MKLSINGQAFEVPREYEEKLMADLLEEGRREYSKIPTGWRVAAKPISRAFLLMIEKEATKKGGKEAGLAVRPPRRDTDANLWLADIFARMLLEGLKYIELNIDTAKGTISAFHLSIESPGTSGGQVGTDRHVGLRQDHSTQVP